MARPKVVVLGGPNGAGKSTVAPYVVRDVFGVHTFVNADDIARGLSGFTPEAAAMQAGRLMLARIAELTAAGAPFAFETTLAGTGHRRVLERCRAAGYEVHLVYLWLPSAEVSLRRVRQRVVAGGHAIPEADVQRRWARSLVNFYDVYRPLAHAWRLFDGSVPGRRLPVVAGDVTRGLRVYDAQRWAEITAQIDAARTGLR